MKKTKKNGFTIVELVIVIAVIAILIAVLIPTFSKIIGKANESNDTQIVRQLNTAIEIESVTADEGKPVTMYDANKMVQPYGLDVEGLATKSNLSIAWDCVKQRFVLLNEKDHNYVFPVDATSSDTGPIPEKERVNYFLVRKTLPDANNEYSIYAASGSEWTTTTIENLTVGLDVGNRTDIKSITYDSSKTHKVVIRTNSIETALTISAPSDTVRRYGVVGQLTITAVDPDDCYYENGFVAELVSFGAGKFVVCETAQFHQTMDVVAAIFAGNENATYVEGKAPQYAQHKWDENGVCEYGHCTGGGANGKRAVNGSHVHTYIEGVCACGETAPSSAGATLSFASNGTYGNNWLGNGLVLTTAEAGTIIEVKIGGNSVDASNYVLSGDNNSIVTINDDYLKTVACTDGRGNAFATGIGYSTAQLVTSNGSTGEEEIKLSGAIYGGAVKTWAEFKELDPYASYGFSNTTDTEAGTGMMSGWNMNDSISSLVFPDTITTLGNNAFGTCTNLVSLIYSKNMTTSGDNAFDGCSNLTTVIIPEGVKNIGTGAFRGCTSLVSIELPSSITYLGDPEDTAIVFEGCSNLESVTINSKVLVLHHQLFTSCPKLADIHYAGTVSEWELLSNSFATDDDGYCWAPTADPDHYTHIAYTVHCSDGNIEVGANYKIEFRAGDPADGSSSNMVSGTYSGTYCGETYDKVDSLSIIIDAGESITLPEGTIEGNTQGTPRTFKCWIINGVEYAPGSEYTPTEGMIINAHYEPLS